MFTKILEYLIVITITLLLALCGFILFNNYSTLEGLKYGNKTKAYNKSVICLNGVLYYERYSKLAPLYLPYSSNPAVCKR